MTWTLGSILTGAIAALAVTAPAEAQAPATLGGVHIDGAPLVGTTLTAAPDAMVDPATVTYEWCWVPGIGDAEDPDDPDCTSPGESSGEPSYLVSAADLGRRIFVKATTINSVVASGETEPVTALPPIDPPPVDPPPIDPPPDDPPPDDSSPTDPTPASTDSSAPTFSSSGTPPAAADSDRPATAVNAIPAPVFAPGGLRYLRPFPVIRVRGTVAPRGARISMLRVTAPRFARVSVRCAGHGCPIRRRTGRAGRIRPLEGFLPAGTQITVRVRRSGYIGKYVRMVIRGGGPPKRRDACMLPGRNRPTSCPRA